MHSAKTAEGRSANAVVSKGISVQRAIDEGRIDGGSIVCISNCPPGLDRQPRGYASVKKRFDPGKVPWV